MHQSVWLADCGDRDVSYSVLFGWLIVETDVLQCSVWLADGGN